MSRTSRENPWAVGIPPSFIHQYGTRPLFVLYRARVLRDMMYGDVGVVLREIQGMRSE